MDLTSRSNAPSLKPSVKNLGWIDELIQQEIDLEETGIVTEENEHHWWKFLDQQSISVMGELRYLFEQYIHYYNENIVSLNEVQHQIKIFKIANTVNDFMLYRQSLKLVFSRKAVDCITATFNVQKKIFNQMNASQFSQNKNYYPHQAHGKDEDTQATFQEEVSEFLAQLGPFQTVRWLHQGQIFHPREAAQGLFSQFIRKSMN